MPPAIDLARAVASKVLKLPDCKPPLACALSWRLILSGEPYVLKYQPRFYLRDSDAVAQFLERLGEGLDPCSDAWVFFHTFQTLGRHPFLTEGFSNDFAQ